MTQRLLSVYVGVSLDGFIARPNGDVDWLEPQGEFVEPEGAVTFAQFMERVDAIIMGRNTFDFVHASGQWHYGATPVFVATTRELPEIPGATLHRVAGSPKEMLAAVAEHGLHRIYVDGGDLVRQFMDAGLIDELVLSRLPISIGVGISLFSTHGDRRWEHAATHANGTYVQSIYRRPDSAT